MKKKNIRPQITWVNKTIAKPANAMTQNLPYFFDEQNYENFKYQKNLILGSLWTWPSDFFLVDNEKFRSLNRLNVHNSVSEYRRLTFQNYDIPGYSVAQGSYMMYAGTVRVDEKAKQDKVVSVLRHTFFVDGTRCIILNLQACVPIL